MCTISITSVNFVLLQSTYPEITVNGTATDCEKVDIHIKCIASNIDVFHTVQVISGFFSTTFNSTETKTADCPCGDSRVTVTVKCNAEPSCFDEQVFSVDCCPNIVTGHSESDECNEGCTRDVTLIAFNQSASTVSANWDYGDNTPLGNTFILQPNTIVTEPPHPYPPGQYTAKLNISGCPPFLEQLNVSDCVSTCETIFTNQPPEECDEIGTRKVTFSVTGVRLCSSILNCKIEFGDSAEHNFNLSSQNPTEIVDHAYSPGLYIAKLIITGCPDKDISINIPACDPQPPPPEPEPESESPGCILLRIVIALIRVFAIVSGLLIICFPSAWLALAGIALGFVLLELAIRFAIWVSGEECPKPCRSGLLMSGQVLLGAGLILICFDTSCCSIAFWAGVALVPVGLSILTWWKESCNFSNCRLAREILYIGSTIVVPLLQNIDSIPLIGGCVNNTTLGIVSAALGLLLLYFLTCVNSPTQSTDEQVVTND